ncbi:MAG: TIGR01906 family membrane protein [Anaerolineae bacterium]|nr:TIGR01906 family membrane protein [Anaerolineae bacterium]
MSSSTQAEEKANRFILPVWLVAVLRVILVAALPLVLLLITARALMTPLYMQWEYNRPGFPADPFGFTQEDRLHYGPLALEYLFTDRGQEFLSEQSLADETPLYNERELFHMNDVKNVTRGLTAFGLGLVALYIAAIALLAISKTTRTDLYASLRAGSILTVALIAAGLIVATTAFDWLFTQFHGLFFKGTSWIFPTSNALIRLFPEQFWIDAFVLLFGGVLIEAVVIGALMWWMMRPRQARPVE